MQQKSFLDNYQMAGEELEILTFPHPILTKKALPVTEFNTPELFELAKNMLYTMYLAPGIGLAAPQIGRSIRLFVLDINYDREKKLLPSGEDGYSYSNFEPLVLINPKVVIFDEESVIYKEGCLSVPEIYEEVERASQVQLTYQNLFGEEQTLEAEGLLSTCIQHENDHLDGIIFLDRLSLMKKNLLKKKLIKRKKRASSTEDAQ